jgi:putative ubiquitin-RnfH superfamily antitoxin RatB of RatAB toxin-antitoxin module
VPANIRVEVAYALPEKQYLQRVTLDEGATVEQAIIASGCWRCVMISIWRKTSWVSTVVR